jgi:hypothetical protein
MKISSLPICADLGTTGTNTASKISHEYRFGDMSDDLSAIQQSKIFAD